MGCRTPTSPASSSSARRPSRATCATSSPSSKRTLAPTRSRSPSATRSLTESDFDRVAVDRLITAEQDERRRIALFLHDGPVQSLAGVALMLDAAQHAISTGNLDQASTVLASALSRTRTTIRELRHLSFAPRPVVLRDQGFAPAVRALADQLGLSSETQIDLDVEAGELLGEKTQIALYTIVRELLDQAVRRDASRTG